MVARLRHAAWFALTLAACGTEPATVFVSEARDCTAAVLQDAPSAGSLEDSLGRATVTTAGTTCRRSYTLATTAPIRVGVGSQSGASRVFTERAGDPFVRTGHAHFDALYALALEELHGLEVAAATSADFGARPWSCGEGGCYKTGEAWPWVWTRNSAYAIDLAGPAMDAVRARNTLLFKVSARRDGVAGAQVVEDLGTGGGYPLSIDRVTWALGARRLLHLLEGEERARFAAVAKDVLLETVRHDRAVAFDEAVGLYRGETSFLNGREQSYPAWLAREPTPVAGSHALSTNVLVLEALELVADLAREAGDASAAALVGGWAKDLRATLPARFRSPDGLVGSYLMSPLDPAPVGRVDLLGVSLAIEAGVFSPDEARAILSAYPLGPAGPPVLWPEERNVPVFHNRAVWPFVVAHGLRAARRAGHDAFVDAGVLALVRAAALNVSNVECFDAFTGDPRTPILSGRQELWSAAAYLSMVQETLFGLELGPGAIRFRPFVTASLHRTLFPQSRRLVLGDLRYGAGRITVVLELPALDVRAEGVYRIASVELDGRDVGERPLVPAELTARSRLHITLAPPPAAPRPATTALPKNAEATWAPRAPTITEVAARSGRLEITFGAPPEDAAAIRYDLRRDGVTIARDLPGTTVAFVDPAAPGDASPSHCYALEARFVATGHRSHPSPVVCFWGQAPASRVHQIPTTSLEATGGKRVMVNARAIIDRWGAPGDEIVHPSFVAPATGEHLFQVVGANGAGPVDTGVACAVKEIAVDRVADGERVGGGVVVLAQRGRWDQFEPSTFARAPLERGVAYRIRVRHDARTINMSFFDHYASYVGAGATAGPENRISVSELRVLTRVPIP